MFTHYQRIWRFNLLVVWPLVWLAYTLQHGFNAISGVGGVLVGLILAGAARHRYQTRQQG